MSAQEELWSGTFGDEYAQRSPGNIDANVAFFERVLDLNIRALTNGRWFPKVESVIEFGAGVGNNLRALHRLDKDLDLAAVEINRSAFDQLPEYVRPRYWSSILDFVPALQYDFAFTKGVLIHIAPEDIDRAYRALYGASRHYILIAEYYNPVEVCIPYRGQERALWKRDFAGEMLDRFPDLELVNYGFVYHRDPYPQDDLTFFLMAKR